MVITTSYLMLTENEVMYPRCFYGQRKFTLCVREISLIQEEELGMDKVKVAINAIEVLLKNLEYNLSSDCMKSNCEFCAGYRIADCKTGSARVFGTSVLERLKEESK